MSTAANKKLVLRLFEEGINQGNLAVVDELVSPDYVNRNIPATPGPAGAKEVIGQFLAAFPDLEVTVEACLAEGDRVATRGYFSGTHRGPFNGIPATGKSIKVTYTDIWRVADGRLAENWVQMDIVSLLQQIGAMPAPAAA